MADDLDDFLKQAALRRQQRQQKKGNKAPSPAPPAQRTPEPPRLTPEQPRLQPSLPSSIPDSFSTPYQATSGSLSTGLPSSAPPSSLEQGGDRVGNNRKPNFQNEISKIRASESKRNSSAPSVLTETPATQVEPQKTAMVSSASMIHQLRDPQTMRMAIIAHEILKRPWQ
jgi:hypothetical protein